MEPTEITVPDEVSDNLRGATREEVVAFFDFLERQQNLAERQSEAGLRKLTAGYLLLAGSVILVVSLVLIVGQAFDVSSLPDAAITTLIASVAVEFVGMLWIVVRYLFPQGSGN